MRVVLPDRWIEHLCGLPETGMGYQVVDVILRGGRKVFSVKVFNAEEVEWPAERGPLNLEEIEDIELTVG